ncbi:MAG: hypothetical protein IPP87_22635 [Ideonella sp.]|nr:hypothetical protein [Ideonella sp.]
MLSTVRRAERLGTDRIDPRVDNMLTSPNDGRKAALEYMRLVDATALADPRAKVVKCHTRCTRSGGSERRASSVPSSCSAACRPRRTAGEFSVYEDLRDHLVARGLPADEIAFIHDAQKTDAQKARLFRRVHEGSVRVLLGSTQRWGSAPACRSVWSPCMNSTARGAPATWNSERAASCGKATLRGSGDRASRSRKGSFDAYGWQTVLTKAKFIARVMSGDEGLRSIEDVELATLGYAEVKALASRQPKGDREGRRCRHRALLVALHGVAQSALCQ